jgi:hypothetical protein
MAYVQYSARLHFQTTIDEILSTDEVTKHDPTPSTLSSAIMTAAKTVLLDEKETHPIGSK